MSFCLGTQHVRLARERYAHAAAKVFAETKLQPC